MRRRREKYKGGGLHRGKGLPRAVRRGRGERARPEGDLKLKLPRFRLDEFISLAGKIACGTPPEQVEVAFFGQNGNPSISPSVNFLRSPISLLNTEYIRRESPHEICRLPLLSGSRFYKKIVTSRSIPKIEDFYESEYTEREREINLTVRIFILSRKKKKKKD